MLFDFFKIKGRLISYGFALSKSILLVVRDIRIFKQPEIPDFGSIHDAEHFEGGLVYITQMPL